jgi:phosphatidylinositol 4-kinase
MPALHGFYRAISSTLYRWTLSQWEALTSHLKVLCSPGIIDRLNRLLLDIVQVENTDADTLIYVQTLVARYVAQGRPLSGYFMVCCVLETEWTILAQALAPPIVTRSPVIEAAAANKAWLSLTRNAALELNIEGDRTKILLKDTIRDTMICFSDLLVQIEQMDTEPSLDTYAWETMSESLVRFHLAANFSTLKFSIRNWHPFAVWLFGILTINSIVKYCYFSVPTLVFQATWSRKPL